MPLFIELRELPERLEEALAALRFADEVILTVDSTPRAKLTAVPVPGPCKLGLHPGAMVMSPDFDDPLPDDFWVDKS